MVIIIAEIFHLQPKLIIEDNANELNKLVESGAANGKRAPSPIADIYRHNA